MDLAELVPAVGTHPRTAWRAAGPVPGHEDCNGRMPSIAKDVFTKMDDRRDPGEDEEEMDYVSARGSGGHGGDHEEVSWDATGSGRGVALEWEGPTGSRLRGTLAMGRRLQVGEQGTGPEPL